MPPNLIINGRFLSQSLTGVQRFAIEMVRAIDGLLTREKENYRNFSVELYCPPTALETNPLKLETIKTRVVGRWGGYAWEQIELPFAARGRLILNLGNMAPVFARKVVTIHDTIVWQMPENYTQYFSICYKTLLPIIAKTSKHCITVSKTSKDSLYRYGIPGRVPVSVVYNGVDHMYRPPDAHPRTEQISWPDRFVFALGSSAPNKNFSLVTDLAPRLRDMGISLVVAGGSEAAVFAKTREIDSGIIVLGRVSDATIQECYRRAVSFVFPSFYEGFGIPPLEAMALGCPVVASNASAIPEILGDAAIYCSPLESDAWCEAISNIVNNPELRASLMMKGNRRASEFRWDISARKLLEILNKIID